MLFFKAIGMIGIFLAFICAGVDGVGSLANGNGLAFSSFGEQWERVHDGSLIGFEQFVRSFSSSLWTEGFATIFALPAWLVLGAIGLGSFAIAGFLGRKGNVFSN